MVNVAQQLARLQLGAFGSRDRPSRHLSDSHIFNKNPSSVSRQCSSIHRSLLSSLQCPAQRVLLLRDLSAVPPTDPTHVFDAVPVFQVAYAHHNSLFVAVDEEGVAGVIDTGVRCQKSRWMAHHNAIFDAIWTQDDGQIVTAAGDLQINIWDVETAGRRRLTEQKPVLTLKGHDMSVKCVRQAPERAHVFASGGRDGRVLLWDTRASKKPVSVLENVHTEPTTSRDSSSANVNFMSPRHTKKRRRGIASASTAASPRSVTCVEFCPAGNEIITAGAADAVVKFWDLRCLESRFTVGCGKQATNKPTPVHQILCLSREGARRGISSLMLTSKGSDGGSRLLVNVLNDSITVMDIGRNQHKSSSYDARTILQCVGQRASSFYSKATFSPDGNFIAGSSADGVVYIWDVRIGSLYHGTVSREISIEQRLPCIALKGHMNEVNGVTWSSRDFTQIASCSDDGTIRCWQVGSVPKVQEPNPDDRARFELQVDSIGGKAKWVNWNAFVKQSNGFAFRISEAKQAAVSLSSQRPFSSTRDRSKPLQRASAQAERHICLHRPVPEPTVSQPQQQPQENPSKRKRTSKLRRTQKPTAQFKRAQRTLLDIWCESNGDHRHKVQG